MLKWLLFDLDNTLVDSDKASRESFFRSCEKFKVDANEDFFQRYKKINSEVWGLFEQAEITAVTLRTLRFKRFFDSEEIQPCTPLEFSTSYLNQLIDTTHCYEHVPELLDMWQQDFNLSIVTNGLREVQRARLDKLGLTKYFNSIIVSDEIGHAKPGKAYFDLALKSIPNPPSRARTLIIGDSLQSDIQGGINAGIKTCWISHGRKNDSGLSINFEIDGIRSLEEVLAEAER